MREKKKDRTQKKACKAWIANIGEGNIDVTSDPYGNQSRSTFGVLDGQNSLLISDKIVIFSHSKLINRDKKKDRTQKKACKVWIANIGEGKIDVTSDPYGNHFRSAFGVLDGQNSLRTSDKIPFLAWEKTWMFLLQKM